MARKADRFVVGIPHPVFNFQPHQFLLLHPDHFDLYLHYLIPASFEGSPNGSGFAGVAAERDGDMLFTTPPIVRRIESDPTLARQQNFNPGMGCNRAYQPLSFTVVTTRGAGLNVATYIARG